MRKIFVFMAIIYTLLTLPTYAQDSIATRFSLAIQKGNTLTAIQKDELKEKFQAVLARADAYAANSEYIVSVNIRITDTKVSEGTLRPFTTVEGELTLQTHNKKSGTVMNATTVKLQDTYAEDGHTDPMTRLIRAINLRDSRYVRFIRNSRNRIQQ